MGIRIKSIYDPVAPDDGLRFLIEQHIPEDVKEEELELSGWVKELAPSPDIRAIFSGDEDSWKRFRRLYYQMLLDPSREFHISMLTERARNEDITLVLNTDDLRRNHGVVLKTLIELRIRAEEDFD